MNFTDGLLASWKTNDAGTSRWLIKREEKLNNTYVREKDES